MIKIVLILVFVEYPFGDTLGCLISLLKESLNPCFRGISFRSELSSKVIASGTLS